MSRLAAVEAALSGDGSCWCHAGFGLSAVAANGGLCSQCKNRSASACLCAHTKERVKALGAAEAALIEEIAGMLARIDHNWRAETSGPGSRSEGRRLEVVQAEAVLRRLAETAGAT